MSEQEEVQIVQDPEEHWADLMEDDLRLLHRDNGGAGGAASLTTPSMAVYKVVSYIVQKSLDFDYQDVLEYGVDGVLGLYDMHVHLTAEEKEHLQQVLLSLGGRAQTGEMTRFSLGDDGEDSALAEVKYCSWNFAREALLKKLFMAALRQHRGQREVTPLEYFKDLAAKLGVSKAERIGTCFDMTPLDPSLIPTGNATREEEERADYERRCYYVVDDELMASMASAGC